MKNTKMLKKIKNKTWATVLTIIALLCYLAFLFIPTGKGYTDLLPFTGSTFLEGSLLNQIIAIFSNFGTAFKNLNILHIATLTLIAFMIFVIISSILTAFYRKRAVYKANIFNAGIAIAVVLFYIIAVVKQANSVTDFKEFFIHNGKFSFNFPTYIPLMAVVALAIAIISSFSAVHGKAFFRIIVVAIACVSLAIFLFPVLSKNNQNFTIVDFLFQNDLVNATFTDFTKIMFIILAYAVFINFILVVFHLGARRYGPIMVIYSALYLIVAAIATILMFVYGKLSFAASFTNATMYVVLSSIAQAIFVFINSSFSRSSIKKQIDILARKDMLADNLDYLGETMQYMGEEDTSSLENFDEEHHESETLPSYTTQEENAAPEFIEIEEEIPLSKKERRKQEKRNKKLAKQQKIDVIETPIIPMIEEEKLEDEPVQEESTTIKIPVETEITPVVYTTPETEVYETETVPEVLPSTDATIIRKNADIISIRVDDYEKLKESKREAVRKKLEQLKLDNMLIDEARQVIEAERAAEEKYRTTEFAEKNTKIQQELEKAQKQKQLLEEEMKAKELQGNYEAQQALNEAKELLESIQREKEDLDQQALENEVTRQALEEAQRMLEEARLTKQRSEEEAFKTHQPQEQMENVLSFLSVKPEYKNMTSAAYDEVPLTEEEENDPFIRTLNSQERLEFYQTFLKPENHKIPAYVLGQTNEEFFDVLSVYLGGYAGKISFELIEKILNYSENLD